MRAILLYIAVALALPISFLRPFGGALIYLWFAYGRPADYVWYWDRFNYGYFIGGATLVGYLIFEIRRSPPRLRGLCLLLLFWIWLALGSVLANNPTLAYPKLGELSRMFVIAFLLAALANSEGRVRYLLLAIGGSIGMLAIKSTWDAIQIGFSYRMRGPGGMMSEENEYALALNIAIPILVWLVRDEPRRWLRHLFLATAACCAITVVATHSRSGFLGLVVASVLLVAYSKRKKLAVIGLVTAGVVLLLLGPEGALERYQTIPTAKDEDPSAIARLQAWNAAWKIAGEHPYFGVGLRNFVREYSQFSNFSRAPHNAVMSLLAEAGYPAAGLFLAMLLLTSARMFWLRWKLLGTPGNEALANYCLILHVTLLVYMVPNLFINRQDFDLGYHLVGIAAGLAWLARRRLAAQRQEAALPREFQPLAWERPASA